MESPGKKCRQEKMWAAVSLYWYQTTHLHFGSGPKCRWSLSGRNVAKKRCGLLSLFIDTRRLIRILEAGQNADGVSRDEMSARKRCGLLSLFIDTRGLIRILGAGQNADGVSRGEMFGQEETWAAVSLYGYQTTQLHLWSRPKCRWSLPGRNVARKRCGLLSLFIDTRRLICILGAGQNAAGVSREEMSARMRCELLSTLYWYQTTHLHFGSRPKCRWSLPERNVARKRCGLLSLFIDTRGLICILGAGQNADGVSREEMSARKRCGLLSLFIDIRRLSCILGAGQNADGVSREEMSPGRDVGCCLSLLIPEDSSAFWERAKMQLESPGKKCRPGRDVGCCLSLLIPEDYAFWEQAKMQMESPGKKCRPGKDVGCYLSLLISDDSAAFWEQAKMQMESPGKKCRPGKDVGCCLSLLISDDSSAFWERAKMQMESPGTKCRQEKMWAAVSLYWYQTTHLHFGSEPKCRWSLPGRNVARKRCGLLSLFIHIRRLICILGAGQNADGVSRDEMSPGRDVGCCPSSLIPDDSSAFWKQAKMQMESPGTKCRQEEMWAFFSLYYQRTHTHFGSRPKCRWSLPGRNVRPGRDVGCCLSLWIPEDSYGDILGAGQNADGVSREEMSPGKDVGCCLSLLISDDSAAFWEQAKMQMESPGKKCRQEEMWAAVSLYWYQKTHLHFGSGPKCSWSLPGRNVGQEEMWAAVDSLLISDDSSAFWEQA